MFIKRFSFLNFSLRCNNSQALKFILDLKMDPNIRGRVTGSSPLAFAVERGYFDVFSLKTELIFCAGQLKVLSCF
jgi:hypothetical protein